MKDNKIYNVGDILISNFHFFIGGEIDVSSFVLELEGLTAQRTAETKFSFSKNDSNYSNWFILNLENLKRIKGLIPNNLYFRLKITRTGGDESNFIEFKSLKIYSPIQKKEIKSKEIESSVFRGVSLRRDLINDLTDNLFKKILSDDFLPKFIEKDNEDFEAFWISLAEFFSILINYFDSFDDIINNKEYLFNYLSSKGVFLNNEETTLEDMQIIANNLKNHIRQRGTIKVFEPKGEIRNLLNKNPYDEFIFEVLEDKHCGHVVDQSSPLYNGTYLSDQINKTPEIRFNDINKYKVLGDVTIDSEQEILSINQGGLIGFNHENVPEQDDPKELITVDDELDYEITMFVRKESISTDSNIRIGLTGFNRNGYRVGDSFYNLTKLQNEFYKGNLFGEVLKIQGDFYFLRFILFGKNFNYAAELQKTNFGHGNNLIFNPKKNVENIYINIENGSVDKLDIKNLNMRPLVRGNNSSFQRGITFQGIQGVVFPKIKNPCFLDNKNGIIIWGKNNSDDLSIEQIKNRIEKFLLSYSNKLHFIELSPQIGDKQLLT